METVSKSPSGPSGQLLAFEGAHHCGKTSISLRVAEKLSAIPGREVLWRAFPGRVDGTLGALIYDLHHHPEGHLQRTPSPLALQALHIAAHIDNIQAELAAALASGVTVVLDRCWWSTWVHGLDGGCDEALLNRLIDIERQLWGAVNCTCFLIRRPEAYTPRLVELYEVIARREQAVHPVEYIENDDSIDAVVDRIVSMLA